MADIFLSYAREDTKAARVLAESLGARGWTVWWDRKILAGTSFAATIERELHAARCVIVLWSKASVSSDWCKNEADDACKRGILVPALIEEDVEIPLASRHLQAVDLTGFNTTSSHPGLEQLAQAIAALVARPELEREVPPQPAPVKPRSRWRAQTLSRSKIALSVVVTGALLALLGVLYYLNRPLDGPTNQVVGIQGIVTDSQGHPVADALVWIDGIQFAVRSNQDGYFFGSLSGPDSVFTLHVYHSKYKTNTHDLRVESLRGDTLHFTMDPR